MAYSKWSTREVLDHMWHNDADELIGDANAKRNGQRQFKVT
jgi:hypothetical protein